MAGNDDSDDRPKPKPRPDNRDVRQFKTPPRGIAEQIGHERDATPRPSLVTDESRPIARSDDPAVTQINERVRTISKDLHANTVATAVIGQRVDAVERTMNSLSVEQKTIGQKVDEMGRDVVEAKTTLNLILEDVRDIKDVRKHREKVEIETDGHKTKVTIDDQAHEKKTGREMLVKRWHVISIIAGAIATAITAIATKGC